MNTSDQTQSPPTLSLTQISYALAYHVLPQYAYNRLAKVEELCHNNLSRAGAFFYAIACQMSKTPPSRADADLFGFEIGALDDQTDFYVMSHPIPPAIEDLGYDGSESMQPALTPFFSGIFVNRSTQQVHYFVLGQNSLGDGTTLSKVTVDPVTVTNLGPGPDADLDSFLASVAFRLEF